MSLKLLKESLGSPGSSNISKPRHVKLNYLLGWIALKVCKKKKKKAFSFFCNLAEVTFTGFTKGIYLLQIVPTFVLSQII